MDENTPIMNRNSESSHTLYNEAYDYLSDAYQAVRNQQNFSLETGFRIIEAIVSLNSPNDPIALMAIHPDDISKFPLLNGVHVAIYVIKMAENLGWHRDTQIEVGMCGLLHDIGMALIPEDILRKPEKLTDKEYRTVQEHSTLGRNILKQFEDRYPYLAETVYQVHEKMDGSGYPNQSKGNEIHEYALIIGLADMYEALIHSRPWRDRFSFFAAAKEIIQTGKQAFEKSHIKALLNVFSIFPMHSYVRLNSNAIGKVIQTYPGQPMRPKLRIVLDAHKRRVMINQEINLPENSLLHIVDSVCEPDLNGFKMQL